MIVTLCNLCKTAYQVVGEPMKVRSLLMREEWKHSFPCVEPLCEGRASVLDLKDLPGLNDVRSVPVESYYRAANGFGKPEGDPAALSRAREVLLTKRIVEVRGFEVGDPKRTIIEFLVMEDGSKLHFSTSGRGACLYYIEEKAPSCLEVVDGQIHNDAVDATEGESESVLEGREEAGRPVDTGEAGGQAGDALGV